MGIKGILGTLVVLSGLACGTNLKIETVIDKGYNQKLNDIAVVVNTPDKIVTKNLLHELSIRLDQNSIKYISFEGTKEEKSKLSLSETPKETPVEKFINSSGKRFILIVNITRLTMMGVLPTHFETSGMIVDLEKKQPVWKFEIKVDRKQMAGDTLADYSDGLIARLKTDGLI